MADFDLVPLVRSSLLEGGLLLAPALLAGLLVALVVGVLQSATGIHEPLIGMVPRLVVMVAVMFLNVYVDKRRMAAKIKKAPKES